MRRSHETPLQQGLAKSRIASSSLTDAVSVQKLALKFPMHNHDGGYGMNAPKTLVCKDPRTGPKFRPEFFPLCDLGDPPPSDTANRNDRVRLEFLAVHYEFNVATAQLMAARNKIGSEERARLEQHVAELSQRRDRLEDFYTPYGVIAEATMAHGIVLNLAFTFPDESRWYHDEKRATLPRHAQLQIPVPSRGGEHLSL
jgi:hypothetical protein